MHTYGMPLYHAGTLEGRGLPYVEAAYRAALTPPLPAPMVKRSKSYCPDPLLLAPLPEDEVLFART